MILRLGNDNPDCQARRMPPARDFSSQRVGRGAASRILGQPSRDGAAAESSTQAANVALRSLRDGVQRCLLSLIGGWAAN